MHLETLKRHWWVPVLRGVAAIIFGVIAFTHPVMAAATLVLFFGAWVLIDGIFRVVGAIGHRASDSDWGFNLIIGILGIIVGLLTFHAPAITALALVIYIAAWAMMIGATEIALAIKMRREIKGEWFLILMGLASIIFAGLLFWNPLGWCGGANLDCRLVRSDSGRSGDRFWLSLAQLIDTGKPLISGKRFQSYHPNRRTVLRAAEAVPSGL